MKRNVICFKSHYLCSHIIKGYKKIVADCYASSYDVVMLYDNSRKDFKPSKVGPQYVLFDTDDLKQIGYCVHEKSAVWYNGDYPLLHFYKQYPNYQYYWMIEYDVHFKGHWRIFFDAYYHDNSDLLAAHVRTPNQEPQWGWWDHHNLDVKSESQRGVFFPVMRFSNRALKFLDEKYKSGKWGFCEVVVPTLLHTHGYKISDLGETFYDRKGFRPITRIPLEPLFLLPKNKLYHPVSGSYLIELGKRLLPERVKKWLKKLLNRKELRTGIDPGE